MKGRLWVVCIFLPYASIQAAPFCSIDTFKNEKSIVKKFQILKNQKKCIIQQENYLAMTIQAYLSENYAIGIWAASSAIKENKSKSMEKMAEFHYYLGISYLGKNRTEEAISVLKKIVFYENYNQIDREILEKSHMALIQAYSENNKNQKNNQNITYLIRLFKARHNKSNMVFNIQDWNGKRYVR